MRKVLKILFFFILIGLLSYLFFYTYLRFYKKFYYDKKYSFYITDQRQWYATSRSGAEVYYAIGTKNEEKNNDKIVSSFSVSPVTHQSHQNQEEVGQKFENTCHELYIELKGQDYQFSQLMLKEKQALVCSFKAIPNHVDNLFLLKQYYLFNPKGEYDYILTVSYPADNLVELEKVESILESFNIR